LESFSFSFCLASSFFFIDFAAIAAIASSLLSAIAASGTESAATEAPKMAERRVAVSELRVHDGVVERAAIGDDVVRITGLKAVADATRSDIEVASSDIGEKLP
jgi:hypothetical protein